MQQREGDLVAAEHASEPRSHIDCGLWARHCIDWDQNPSQCHGAIVERNKAVDFLGNEQRHPLCTTCHRFSHHSV